jgi:hypothetical protein
MRKRMFESVFVGVFLVSFISVASAQDLTCGAFTALSEDDQFLLAYGYLEGVQGALDKEVTDILVPPSDPKHPVWWVLPTGLANNPTAALARMLKTTCQPTDKRATHLVQAFLSMAYQREGSPTLGISSNKKQSDTWRNVLGRRDSISCSAYIKSQEKTRQSLVDGYYLGTEAFKVALKSSVDVGIAWPSKLTPRTVRLEVDKRCQKEGGGSIRDVLWVTTAELGVKN